MCVKRGRGEGGMHVMHALVVVCDCELYAHIHTLNVCVHMGNIIIPLVTLQSKYNIRSFPHILHNRVGFVGKV